MRIIEEDISIEIKKEKARRNRAALKGDIFVIVV